jgi:hypothetical protein
MTPKVTQADREAAEPIIGPACFTCSEDHPVLQIFAHHRITQTAALREALEEASGALSWINTQAENAMATAAGCATTHGDDGGGLEMLNSIASDIGINAMMQIDKIVQALSHTQGEG